MSRFMAAIYDRFMRDSERACLVAWRAELLAGVAGDVLEIGAGTGASLPHYGPAVTRLVLAEPDPHMRRKLEARLRSDGGQRDSRVEHVAISHAPASALPFADASFDVVVSMLVLCSVRDVAATLCEVARVLRPGGRFVFLEHVAADDGTPRLAWQRRIEPFWKHLAGNCHLTRHTDLSIGAAGFAVESLTRESMRKAMPFLRPTIRGVARKDAP